MGLDDIIQQNLPAIADIILWINHLIAVADPGFPVGGAWTS